MYTIYRLAAHLHRGLRSKCARKAAGFVSAQAAAEAFGWNRNTYASNENGNAPYSYARAKAYGQAFRVRVDWLFHGEGGPKSDRPVPRSTGGEGPGTLAPVIGRVGADPEGRVLFSTGRRADDMAPLPPGGSRKSVALRVDGHAMDGLAEDGGLIYFEDRRSSPSKGILRPFVVVVTERDEVFVTRLQSGSKPDYFDLEGVQGSLCRLRWATPVIAIIPPHQAGRIIRSARGVE